ncbi:hypothetical protein AAGG74_15095 [Bacillus mexicanus]|uniref:hypothetical protein n=1 Tax=Bacillus mexicanus TaxID=2834415 RepID=UPI003D1EDBB1
MKLFFNQVNDDLSLFNQNFVSRGDTVFANSGAKKFGFTVGKGYKIVDVNPFGFLKVRNDLGNVEDYKMDFFQANPISFN